MSDFDNYINGLKQLDQSELKVELENFYSMNYAVKQIYKGIDNQITALLNAQQLNEKIVANVLAMLNKHLENLSKLKFKLNKIKPERLCNELKTDILDQLEYIKEQMVLSEIDMVQENLNELLQDNEKKYENEQQMLERQKLAEESRKREAEEEDKWQLSEKNATIKGYNEFILVYPNSKYVALAKHRNVEIENLEKLETERLQCEEKERLQRKEKELKEKEESEKIITDLNMEMVFVECGTFNMGDKVSYSAQPIHSVTLSNFYIGKYPVTQKQWMKVMGSNPSTYKGKDNPVGNVSYFDCQKFVVRLNKLTGKKYRLPTEAEWEYAARGGKKSKGYEYAGSNNINEVAWFERNSSRSSHPVGEKVPNELGLYDMSGNVWEWCNDWYGNYESGVQTNPQGPALGIYRMFRGCSWGEIADNCRVSNRCPNEPGFRDDGLGFRLGLVP